MYFFGWIALVAVSLWASLVAFIWALKSGQFADQSRARYLPLSGGLPASPDRSPSKWTIEVYALLIVAILGLLGFLCTMVLSFYRWVN